MAKTYTANVARDGKFWVIEVPEVPGAFSQEKRLEDVWAMAREVTALMLDVPESEVEIAVVLRQPFQGDAA